MRSLVKYISAIFFCCILTAKSIVPVIFATLSSKNLTELVTDIENGESKKDIPQPAETELYFPFEHFITTGSCILPVSLISTKEQHIQFKQNAFLSVFTPPPETA